MRRLLALAVLLLTTGCADLRPKALVAVDDEPVHVLSGGLGYNFTLRSIDVDPRRTQKVAPSDLRDPAGRLFQSVDLQFLPAGGQLYSIEARKWYPRKVNAAVPECSTDFAELVHYVEGRHANLKAFSPARKDGNLQMFFCERTLGDGAYQLPQGRCIMVQCFRGNRMAGLSVEYRDHDATSARRQLAELPSTYR